MRRSLIINLILFLLSCSAFAQWQEHNGGISGGLVYVSNVKEEVLYAGSDGGGVFRASLADFGMSGVDEKRATSVETALPIFPNPAIEYIYLKGIKEGLSIRIYSPIGERVFESAYANSIDTAGLASVVYYRISGVYKAKFVKNE